MLSATSDKARNRHVLVIEALCIHPIGQDDIWVFMSQNSPYQPRLADSVVLNSFW